MTLARIIRWLHPAADPLRHYEVRDDGAGPYIAYWDEQAIGSPQPTEQELLAQADTVRLEQAKAAKIAAIDARSHELLTAGLEVADGAVISTSDHAQRNLTQLVVGVQGGLTTLPRGVSTIDAGEYIIADAQDLARVAGLWADRLTTVLDAGRALRLAVLAAETVEAVNAIVDERE